MFSKLHYDLPGSAGPPPPPPPNGSSSPSLWCGVVVGCFPLPVVVSCGWGVGLLRLVPPLPPVVWCGFGFPAWVCLACEPSCGKKRAQSHRFGLGSVGGGGYHWGGGGSVNREPGSYIHTHISMMAKYMAVRVCCVYAYVHTCQNKSTHVCESICAHTHTHPDTEPFKIP